MAFEDEYLDVLQNIEFAIQSVYKIHDDLTDYDALSAIEAVIDFYIAEERKREPRDFKLSAKSLEVYDAVKEICNFLLGRDLPDDYDIDDHPLLLSVSEITNCLKTIRNSISKWTKRAGRQGYLNFVKNYMPDFL
ncbi:hypothetical protein BMS3Abin03_00968 [bacterium BMS3Abin03]|nr:hypothetical protein BMS3Abin03_00968 [bacterium BMS3Abin03]